MDAFEKAKLTTRDQIAYIRRMARTMTPADIEAATRRVAEADAAQAGEYAARGTRTSPQASVTIWTYPEFFAAKLAEGEPDELDLMLL